MHAPLPPPRKPPPPTHQHPDAPELERLTFSFLNLMNTHDFDFQSPASQELRDHISPDYLSEVSMGPVPNPLSPSNFLTFDEQISRWRKRARDKPNFHFEVQNISSDINAAKLSGTVFIDMHVYGDGDLVLHGMNTFTWKMNAQGKWMCCSGIGLRGSLVNAP